MRLAGSTTTRPRPRNAVIGAIVLLGAVSCGGGEDTPSAAGDSSPTGPPAARNHVLTEGPETAGLTVGTGDTDTPLPFESPTEMFDADLAACLGRTPDAISPKASDTAHSVTFVARNPSSRSATETSTLQAGSLAAIHTPEEITALRSVLDDPDYLSCQNQSLAGGSDDDSDSSDPITMTELPTPDGALAAYRLAVTPQSNVDMIHLAGDRVFCTLLLSSFGEAPDPALEARLARQIADTLSPQTG